MADNPIVKDLVGGTRNVVGQGMLMGWGDELESWVRSTLGREPYNKIKAQIAAEKAQYDKNNPTASSVQEFLGGAAPTALAALIPGTQGVAGARAVGALSKLKNAMAFNPASSPVKRAIIGGGALGAIGASGNSEGNPLLAGLYGAAGGAALGGALVGGAKLLGAGGSAIKKSLFGENVDNEAQKKLLEQMRNAGVTPQDLLNKARLDYPNGYNYRLDSTPSIIAHSLPNTAEGLITKGGNAKILKLEDKLRSLQVEATPRIENKLKKILQPSDYYQQEEEIINRLRSNAKTLYDKAEEYGTVSHPKILEALKHPTFKKAFEEAEKISQTEALAAKLAGEDPSKFILKKLYSDEAGDYISQPDVRTLNYVKRGLDSIIDKGYRGEGMSSAEANGLKKVRNNFVAALDEEVPDYAVARQSYAGDMEIKDALKMGHDDFNKMEHEQISNFMQSASKGEKEAFKTGTMRHLQNTLLDRPNASGKIINSNKLKDKIRALVDSPQEFNLLHAALEKEALMYKHASNALSGSRTALREAQKQNLESVPNIPNNLQIIPAVLQFVRGIGTSPETMGKMAEMLSKGTPQEVAQVVKILENQQSKINLSGAIKQSGMEGALAGTSGGTTIPGISADVSGGDVLLNGAVDWWNKSKEPKAD